MSEQLNGKRIAFLFTDGVEQAELTEPLAAIKDAGAEATLVSLQRGEIQMFNHRDHGDRIEAERAVAESDAREFDGLVLPGGVANPDALRTDPDAVRFVRGFFDQGKPVGVICHGPWTMIEADVVQGRTLTSWPSLKTDIKNAGGDWVDEEVHVEGSLVSSRKPDDIPAFCAHVIAVMAGDRAQREA
ncbi:MAG TPA: type 1 glutamine amidotransferase domain-containing protein [Solirubrobacteraceae bacterium]|jgi:protease I